MMMRTTTDIEKKDKYYYVYNGRRTEATLMMMMMVTSCVLTSTEAHVKLRYSYNDEGPNWPIRNAPSAQADGDFSVSGPCGGNAAWGANGFTTISNGASVDLRISYNGGHQSNANAFHLEFHCDDESALTQDIFPNGDYAVNEAGCTNIAATDSRVNPPYDVSCTLPSVQGLTVGSDPVSCTISVMDQREWGGCYDVKVTPDDPPAPGAGTDSQLGTDYLVSDVVSTTPSGTSCCQFQSATLRIGSLSGSSVAVEAGGTTNCANSAAASWQSAFTLTKQDFTYTNGASGTRYRTDVVIGNETFEFNLINSVLTSTNQGTEQPVMCDHVFSTSSSDACSSVGCLPSFFSLGEPCSSNGGALGGAIVGIIALVVVALALVLTEFAGYVGSRFEGSNVAHLLLRFLQSFLALIAFAAYSSSDGTTDGACEGPSGYFVAAGVLTWLYTTLLVFFIFVERFNCSTVSGISGYGVCSNVCVRYAMYTDLFFFVFSLLAIPVAAYNNPETEKSKGAIVSLFFCCLFLIFSFASPLRDAIFGAPAKAGKSTSSTNTKTTAFEGSQA